MCNVANVMTRNVLTVAAEATAKDAAWGLTMKGISGAPVKDDTGQLIGVLSKTDLIDPEKKHGVSSEPSTVRDHMTPVLVATRTGDPLKIAVRKMVDFGIHRLMVVDERGELAGILTPMDVLRALLDGRVQPDAFADSDA